VQWGPGEEDGVEEGEADALGAALDGGGAAGEGGASAEGLGLSRGGPRRSDGRGGRRRRGHQRARGGAGSCGARRQATRGRHWPDATRARAGLPRKYFPCRWLRQGL